MIWYLENKYSRWYFQIIENRKQNPLLGYTEKHHVLPRSMGGTDDEINLVKLTAREHFVCHLLLIKMTRDAAKRNMAYAISIMASKKRYFPKSSRVYELIRVAASNARKEYWDILRQDPEAFAKRCESTRFVNVGRKLSDVHKEKLRLKSEGAGRKYVVESPSGEISEPRNFAAFCRERGLSHITIKQAYFLGKGDKRVQKGLSMGWRIIGEQA